MQKKKRNIIKKFTKKWPILKNKRVVITATIILIAIIITLSQASIKFSFLAKNELRIGLEPLQESINSDNNQPIYLNFTVKNYNFRFCNTYCEYTLYDPYKEKIMFQENETLKSNSEIGKSYTLNLNTRGEGQRIFYFEVECNNIQTQICQTDEKKVFRSSFVKINHKLTESEKAIMNSLKKDLNDYSEKTNEALNLIEENQLILADIEKSIKAKVDIEEFSINNTLIRLEKFEYLWDQDQYNELNSEFLAGNTNEITETIDQLQKKKEINLVNTNAHNTNVIILNKVITKWETFSNAYRLYLRLSNLTLAKEMLDLSKTINARTIVFNNTLFENFHKLEKPIQNVNNSFVETLKEYEKANQRYQSSNANSIKTHSDIQSKIFNALGTNQLNLNGQTCDDFKELIDNYQIVNANAATAIKNYSMHLNKTEFITLKIAHKKSITENLLLNFDQAANEYTIGQIVVKNTLNISSREYNSILQFNESVMLKKVADIACQNINQNLTLSWQYHNQINITPYVKKQIINIKFNTNQPKCCIFNSCTQCYLNSSLYPTILIHGHSALENFPVEQSLMSFSKIQKKLSYEDNFINVGDIDFSTPNMVWSEMQNPVTVKASYYYISYYDVGLIKATVRKSQSIENYAIRLKELIDIVKTNTGAQKVNLVAHSMGGLVARDYIMLFGEENVNKVILIGTPNNGISGKARKFCSTIGSNKECEDMYKDSIFLKKLNNHIPKKLVINVIYGTGCDTGGKDGDGAVTVQDAILNYSKNYEIKGKCEGILGTELHSDMLDPSLYPEVYETIVAILKE